jgi:hypothetical protein
MARDARMMNIIGPPFNTTPFFVQDANDWNNVPSTIKRKPNLESTRKKSSNIRSFKKIKIKKK